MVKIALNAGHGRYTAGKRCLQALDPNETREWVLNSRICEKIEEKLKSYKGYELLRIDDRTGKTDIPLKDRTDKANKWGADVYIAIHANAGDPKTYTVVNGVKCLKGGGIVAITYPKVDNATTKLQKELYDALIKHTGLKGNRATPLAKMNLHECRETRMTAVLLELGFMDSYTDVPIILSDTFANNCANAIVEVLVRKYKLQKIEATNKIYRVQVGPYGNIDDANATKEKLKALGFDAVVV